MPSRPVARLVAESCAGWLLFAVLSLLAGCASAPQPQPQPAPPSHALPPAESTLLDRAVLKELGDSSGVSGVRLVQQNPLAFAYRLDTARKAERSLDVQYYIWHDDFTGGMLAMELIRAAQRGVRVRVLLDDLDVHDKRAFLAVADQHPNLEVRVFNPILSDNGALGIFGELVQRGGRLNHRMHNKAWIADNRVAIIGGRNIGDEYFGAAEGANFSDTGLVMAGPVVEEVSRQFDAYWNSAAAVPVAALAGATASPADLDSLMRDSPDYVQRADAAPFAAALSDERHLAEMLARRPPPVAVRDIRVLADDPAKVGSRERGVRASRVLAGVAQVMDKASSELLIISPYFVPGDSGADGLTALVQRGVRVAVLTNSLAATDVVGVHAGYSQYRRDLLRGGVELYEMKRSVGDETGRRRISWTGSSQASLHTKAVVVDDRWVFVGSMNLDPRSVNINTEMGVLVESPELAAQLREQFRQSTSPDMSHSLVLDDRHGLAWRDRVDGRERTLHGEPGSTVGRRLTAFLMRLLPLESQL